MRARELRPDGRLIIVLPDLDDHGCIGFEDLFNHADKAIAEMVETERFRPKERARMVIANQPRQQRDLLAPFGPDGQFNGLTVEHFETFTLADTGWIGFERDGNRNSWRQNMHSFSG